MKIILPGLSVALVLLALGCNNSADPAPSNATSTNAMNQDTNWTDTDREDLRDTLRRIALGEVRFAQSDNDDILQQCRDVYIEDECPKEEWNTFVEFASDALKKAAADLQNEQANWPAETDNDRLDQVEQVLRERGILFWQASPCCDTCSSSELPDRIDYVDKKHPGFRKQMRGYVFYIDQTIAEMLADDTNISVYCAYGSYSPDEADASPEIPEKEYEKKALAIANELCEVLRENGFEIDWDGNYSRKVGISLNWQRRTMLD